MMGVCILGFFFQLTSFLPFTDCLTLELIIFACHFKQRKQKQTKRIASQNDTLNNACDLYNRKIVGNK